MRTRWRPDLVEWQGGNSAGRLINKAGRCALLYMRRGQLVRPGDWLTVNGRPYRVLSADRSLNSEPRLELEEVHSEPDGI